MKNKGKEFGKSTFCRLKYLLLKFNNNSLYKYHICKQCRQCMRLPKNKGTFIVTCPHCGYTSEVDT